MVEARLRLQGDFLTDLLDNPAPPEDTLLERARQHHDSLEREFRLLTLSRPEDRAHVIEPDHEARGRKVVWSHPAFARRCVFIRNDKEILCVSLAAQG